MKPADADIILNEVGNMLTEALKGIQFSAGNAQTKVISGFPLTVVGVASEDAGKRVVEDVAPPFERYWYFENRADGNRVFFVPLDPATQIDGDGCYESPPPSILVPPDQERVFFLKQTFTVTSFEHCEGSTAYVGANTVTPGQAEIVALPTDELPEESFPIPATNACGTSISPWGGGGWYYPGEYVIYFPLVWLRGTANAAPEELGRGLGAIPSGEYGGWAGANPQAASMMRLGPNGAGFPRWAESGWGLTNNVAGDTSGMAAGLVLSYAPP